MMKKSKAEEHEIDKTLKRNKSRLQLSHYGKKRLAPAKKIKQQEQVRKLKGAISIKNVREPAGLPDEMKKLKRPLGLAKKRVTLLPNFDEQLLVMTKTELKLLDRMAKRVVLTTTKAMRAIDKTLSLVAASERRMERRTRSIKKKPTRARSKNV